MRNGEIKKDSKPAGRGLRGGFVHRENRSVRIIPLGGLKEIGKKSIKFTLKYCIYSIFLFKV